MRAATGAGHARWNPAGSLTLGEEAQGEEGEVRRRQKRVEEQVCRGVKSEDNVNLFQGQRAS